MARFVDAIDLDLPIEAAFDALADFSRTADWDPGVVEARRISSGEVGVGSRFRVVAAFLGRRIALDYRISEFERPSRLVLIASDPGLRSVDEITLVRRGRGTRVTYEARLELRGIARLADPLLHLVFQQIGRRAARGMRERLRSSEQNETSGDRESGRSPRGGARAAQRRGASGDRHAEGVVRARGGAVASDVRLPARRLRGTGDGR